MAFIRIKSLTASGPGVEDSTIIFGKKLTVIAGPSDTGKTCIYKCIDYILGGNNDASNLPFDEEDKYNTVAVELETHKGKIKLTREQKSSSTYVNSEIEDIKSGEYVLKESKKNQNTINSLFLKLIDIPVDIKLPKNDKGKPGAFTWRTIKNSFIIDEHRADTDKSILLEVPNQPLYLASLIYLISGNELNEYKGDKEAELIKKTKKNTLLAYIKQQREMLEKKKISLELKLQNIPEGKTIDEYINELNKEIDLINQKIDDATKEYAEINKEKIEINTRLTKNKALIERYTSLSTQYSTDINRLTFIVDNEELIKGRVKKTKCPYCDSDIIPKDQSSYIQASQAELVKAVKNSQDLEETRVFIQNQIDDDEMMQKDCNERLAAIQSLINKEYIPQRNQIAKQIQQFREYLQIEGSLSLMAENDADLKSDLEKIESEPVTSFTPFKGKPLFYNLISAQLVAECQSILEEIGYDPITSVEIVKSTLDLKINGKTKANRGKGYKAFTNSVLLLGFRKFMNQHSAKCYNFYMFDSPLKGLALPDIDVSANIRAGFFKYLVNNQLEDQVIIMENTHDNEIPPMDESDDVKIYKFTQDPNDGRYGFLLSVRRK